jgi:hypothetical protein
MQHDIAVESTARPIHLFGVNGAGHEVDNDAVCSGRSLPWLQDTSQQNVWARWHVNYRDVVVLDGENRVIRVYNLTDHDLAEPAYFAELKNILLQAAR